MAENRTSLAPSGLAFRNRLTTSAVPYVGSLMLTALAAGWANYLSPLVWPEGFSIRGQALAIVIPIVLFPISVLLWLVYKGKRIQNPWAGAFLIGLGIAWVIHMVIIRHHGDQYPHTVWLFIPVLVMFYFKAPQYEECWTVILIFAWSAGFILVTTRVLEGMNAIPMFRLDPEIIEWEKERYWLPVSDLLGINGRWPGPFGYNSKTGFIGALLVLISIARWSKSSWVLLPIGLLVVLATASRGSFLALASGLAVLAVFTHKGPFARIPIAIRTVSFAALTLILALLFVQDSVGTTGRFGSESIWGNFLTLWRTSPWLGVGQVGILADPNAGISMEAHNLLIQHLTRFGVIGVVTQYAAIAIALGLMAVAAYHGMVWPLAVTVSYYIASVTEVLQDGWLEQSLYSLLIVLATMSATTYLQTQSLEPKRSAFSTSSNR